MGDQTFKIIYIIIAGLGLILVVFYLTLGRSRPSAIKTIKVGAADVNVEIADTLAAQQRGLSGRASLAPDAGMLFVYQDKAIRYFWMPDMRFSLDVLWVADGRVVGIQENIPPFTPAGEITRFQSNAPVDMVLEMNAGWIARNGVKIGEAVVQN